MLITPFDLMPNHRKVQFLLQELPKSVICSVEVEFTGEHENYFRNLNLNPGKYPLKKVIRAWREIVSQHPEPIDSPEVNNASLAVLNLLFLVDGFSNVRKSYTNPSSQQIARVLRLECNHSGAPPALFSRKVHRRKLIILGVIGMIATSGVTLLYIWESGRSPSTLPRPFIEREQH